MDQSANNPPAVNTPIIYGSMDTFLGASAARPGSVFSLERDAQTPSSYNWSIGIQRELGWGTVVDLTYVGNVTRHLELATNINVVPDGPDSWTATRRTQPPEPGHAQGQHVPAPLPRLRGHHPAQPPRHVELQRPAGAAQPRYSRFLQFAIAYTFAKALGVADDDEHQ